jgi:hypothetical protein
MRTRHLLLFSPAVVIAAGCLGSVDRLYVDGDAGMSTSDGGNGEGQNTDGTHSGGLVPASIGGRAIGLAGPGLVLQNAGKDDLAVVNAGPYAFKTQLFPGEHYDVTVLTQPVLPSQKCTVGNGTGTANGVDVTNVDVHCVTDSYKVGGNVVGLVGSGLVLQNNGGDDLAVSSDTFAFGTPIPSGGAYSVTIKTQPQGQTCSVGGGTGSIVSGDVDTVVINCLANSYIVGGDVSGLAGSLVLQNNNTNDCLVTANGSFAFSTPIVNNAPYLVTVKAQPTSPISQTCQVTQGNGIVASADVKTVKVACSTNRYTVGGSISGLKGTVVLQNNGTNDTTITNGSSFKFSNAIASGSAYAVTVKTQPLNQACQITKGSGTITNANVGTVTVKCSTLVAFSENFDGVTAPTLPNGWTSTVNQGNIPWKSDTANPIGSAPNSAYVHETIVAADVSLDSPTFPVESSTAVLTFENKWYFPSHYGGGVLEISIAGGAFQDIIDAGGVFMSGPYVSDMNSHQTPLGSRMTWTDSGGPIATSVRLPAAAAGKSVQLRWRFVTSFWSSDKAWRIDDIVVRN